MSDQNSYEKLGLTEDASFEEIQEARNHLLQQHRGDQKCLETIEAAYDAILMNRLKMRQEGKIKVPERIRFPEKLAPSPLTLTPVAVNRVPGWLQQLLDSPSRPDVLWPGGLFAILGILAVSAPSPDLISLAIAFGVGVSLYFLNRKERKFGRAVLLTLAGLFVGIGLGTLLASWLVGPIVNIHFLTPDKFLTLVTFFVLWLVSSFLR